VYGFSLIRRFPRDALSPVKFNIEAKGGQSNGRRAVREEVFNSCVEKFVEKEKQTRARTDKH
jgi:hypothetical protein